MSFYNFMYRGLYKKLPLRLRVLVRDVYLILKYGSKDMFITIGIETSSKCNLRCPYCVNRHVGGRGINYMSMELFKKIISELVSIDYHGNISPGFYAESLLDDRLISMFSYINDRLPKATIMLFSNATKLTVSKYRELISVGVKTFILTGHNALGRRNIKLVQEFRRTNPDKAVFNVIKLDMTNLINRGGLVPLINVKLAESCIDPSRYVAITYEGNVLLCCNDYLEKTVLGNLKSESLMSVWRKDLYKNLRSDIKRGVFNLRMCQKCGYGSLPKGMVVK